MIWNRYLLAIQSLLVAASLLVVSIDGAQQPVVVESASLGTNVTGTSQDGVDAFLGIQFATVGPRFTRSTLIGE